MNRIKRISFRIAVVGFACVAFFAAAELLVRIISPQPTGPSRYIYHPQLGPLPVPNQDGRITLPGAYSFKYSNNSYGLRGSRDYSFGESEKFRILILGDSFTYGLGVDDNETFSYKIERILSTPMQPVEVINAGATGRGTDYALKFFLTLGYKFKPDLTILCFFYNDFCDNGKCYYYGLDKTGQVVAKPLSDSLADKKQILNRSKFYQWLITWSHFANFLKRKAVDAMLIYEGKTKTASQGTIISYPDDKESLSDHQNKELTEIFIKNLKESVEASGSKFIVFYIPAPQEIKGYRMTHGLSKDEININDILESQKTELLSLTSIISDSGSPIDELYYIDLHFTPLAHSIAAEFMSRHIKECLEGRRL